MNQHFLWHWKQQTVPLRGKNYITGDPTQHVIIPKPFFSKVLQVFHCTAALQPVAETLEIIKGSWFVISNISNYPFFSHFSSLERLFCKSMKSKNPVIFSPLRCVDRCVVARIMAMSHEKKKHAAPANGRSSISITQGDTMLFGHCQKAVDVLKADKTFPLGVVQLQARPTASTAANLSKGAK